MLHLASSVYLSLTPISLYLRLPEVSTTWINMESQNNCVKLLFDNPADEALSAADVLLKIANNILNNPDNQKYRTLKVANATVSSKLLPVSGAMECLFEMGFEEVNKKDILKLKTASSYPRN